LYTLASLEVNLGRLDGKVALITGTGGGQGRAAALRFALEGAAVVGCDVKEDGNRETVAAVKAAGGSMTGMEPIDLGEASEARDWVQAAAAIHGRVDILYNNASMPRFGFIDEMSVEDWHFTIRNELDLVFYVTKYAWPFLAERGGVVLSTASVSGMIGAKVNPAFAHAAAKGAVLAMTKQLAVDGASKGIRVISISPGPIETPGSAEVRDTNPEVFEMMTDKLLLRRLGRPEEIAAVAAFLASDDASFITGANIAADGGWTAF
jgi:meso-butanediol dehydrogenase/(S,S)-butanediol dehydrogenase/diacetyl reductase